MKITFQKKNGAKTRILNTTLDEIYEPEYGVYVINGDNAHGNFGNNHTFNNNSDFIFDTLKKYIQKLVEENDALKNSWKWNVRSGEFGD